MSFVAGILGGICVFVAPVAGWVAFQSFRDGDYRMGWGASASATVALGVVLITMVPGPPRQLYECRVEWDARSNPTVCD